MVLIPGLVIENKDSRIINWKFIPFIILCFILGILLIYLLLPEFFSGPIIQRIPIIIEEQNDQVMPAIYTFLYSLSG